MPRTTRARSAAAQPDRAALARRAGLATQDVSPHATAAVVAVAADEFFAPLEPRQLLSSNFSPVDPLFALRVSTTASPVAVFAPRFVSQPAPLTLPSRNSSLSVDATTASARSLIGLDRFIADPRFAGITGRGFTSVVIDTGINASHRFFGPDADSNGSADRILAQLDFTTPTPTLRAPDASGHGSNVASIIASQDPQFPGVAREGGIIALRVFDDQGRGSFGSVERALQWVIDNARAFNIASVNLSLGDSQNHAAAAAMYGLGDEFSALAQRGVLTFASAGNSFFSFNSRQGLAYPAADPNVVAVGATFAGGSLNGATVRYGDGAQGAIVPDRLAPFSQRSSTISTVLAPGAPVPGAGLGSSIVTMHGTSQASPQFAGAALLAQQLANRVLGRSLSVAEFRSLVASSSDRLTDAETSQDNVANSGATFGRLNVFRLGEAILALASSGGNPATPSNPPTNPPSNPPAPINQPPANPSFTRVNPFIVPRMNVGVALNHAAILRASDASNPSGGPITFRLASINVGRVLVNGRQAAPGALIDSSSTIIWSPPLNHMGVVSAFSLVALNQAGMSSGVAVPVRFAVGVVNSTPIPGGLNLEPQAIQSPQPLASVTPAVASAAASGPASSTSTTFFARPVDVTGTGSPAAALSLFARVRVA